MLRYPDSVSSQQGILAPLTSIVQSVSACEDWISFLSQVSIVYSSLSAGALKNLATMASSLANVFDYLYENNTQSIYSSQYLLKLSISARSTAANAQLAAPISTGTLNISLSQNAQNALETLSAWDPVQGYQAPDNPGALASTLLEGVSIG
jgi:hypothetical protein